MWRISYLLNFLTGGSIHELLCYRLHQERRVFWIGLINFIFQDPKHVAKAARWQRRHNNAKAKADQERLEKAQDQPSTQTP